MKILYSKPGEIGSMVIKNRFVRSATYVRRASEDGKVTEELDQWYKILAQGGVGLIITEFTVVHPSGQGYPNQLRIYSDDYISGLRRLANTIHEYGDGCKAVLQLAHCGRQSMFQDNPIAPSALLEPAMNIMPREMTIEEIEEIIDAFAKGAGRAMEAGFDGVQLHAAHGYLLSGFLSSHTNKRTDEFGGDTDNRIKIVEQIYKRSVEIVGKDFPIMMKMNVDDFLEDGIKLEESKKIAEKLSKIGFAAIETSGAMWEILTRTIADLGFQPAMIPESRININSKDKEAYFLPYAKEIKKVIDVPLILVGGLRSIDVIEKILAEGSADFVALSRPLIREPNLVNDWLKGIGNTTCKCVSCNGCVGSVLAGSIRCTQEE